MTTAVVRRPSLDAVRGFDTAVYVVALGQLVNVFGSGLVYPFATIHFHLRVGVSLAVVGFGLGVKSVATAAGTALGGLLADRVGRKPVMVGSMAGSAVTLSAFAFVGELATVVPASLTTILDVSPVGVAFVAVATVSGLTVGLYPPAAQAMVADLTGGERRDDAYALLKLTNNVGFGAGFVVGGVLYSVASVAVFVGDGLTSGVVAVVLLAFVPGGTGATGGAGVTDSADTTDSADATDDADNTGETTAGESATDSGATGTLAAWWAAATEPRVVALAALNVGFAVLYAQMQTTVPVVAESQLGLSTEQVGTLYVLNPLTLVVLQLPLVDAVREWRRTRGLVVSVGFWAVSMVAALGADLGVTGFGLSTAAVGVVLVGGHLVLRTVGEVLHSPLVTALVSDLGEPGQRGTQLSLVEIAKRLGMGLGSFGGGLFFDAGLSTLLWPTLLVVCLLVAVGLLALERRLAPEENGRGREQ